MAIAFDAATDGGNGGANFSHSCTGSNLILLVGVWCENGTCTGVTYNGVAMTQAVTTAQGSDNIYFFYLLNPATGSHTVSMSAGGGAISAIAASYTGVRQAGQPDATQSNAQASGTTLTQSITTVQDNAWVVGYGGIINHAGVTWSAGLTDRSAPDSFKALGDATTTTAGALSTTCTFGSAISHDFVVLVAIDEYRALTTSLTQGSYTLTGQTLGISMQHFLTLAQGAYSSVGNALSFIGSMWNRMAKSSSSFSNQSKNSSAWTNKSKSASTFTNQNKSS